MEDFRSLGLAEPLLSGLQEIGYSVPTAIQLQAIPAILEGRDLEGIARTGTGKTAAYALPLLHRLLSLHQDRPAPLTCRALVLAPTRELAGQIGAAIRAYARRTPLRVTVMIGGIPKAKQARTLAAGIEVLVATPGRLLDHLSDGALRLDETGIFVLDEADHMLDLGFVDDVRQVAAQLPQHRQTLLFSATMPAPIALLAKELLHDPLHVGATEGATTSDRIEQRVIFAEPQQKRPLLIQMIKRGRMTRTLVFTRTKQGADAVVAGLDQAGIRAAAIHGDKSQPLRERTLAGFRSGVFPILVATDIAARGIDVEGLTHVVNFDLPDVPEAYIHRIGRTARAGARGIAISFCAASERHALRDIERLLGVRIKVYEARAAG